jgi:hypothetical protein
MIALLFALLAAAMLLALRRRMLWANLLFAAAIVLGAYWLDFHATSQLSIDL